MSQTDVLRLAQTGFAALNAGRLAEAEDGADTALKLAPKDANALFLKGAARLMSGDAGSALPWLRKADKAAPKQVNILNMLATAEWQCGRPRAARQAFEAALAVAPKALDPLYNLARLLRDEGQTDAAEEKLGTVLSLQPNHPGALSALARLKANRHRLDEARPLAERLLAIDPGDPLALAVKAQADLADGDAAGVAEQLRAGLAHGRGTPVNRALALGRLGEALEKSADAPAAFAAFAEANALLRERFADYGNDTGFYSRAAAETQARFWSSREPGGNAPAFKTPAPVFLVGFPRSGTTLLENILATHPAIETVEEQDLLLPVLEAVAGDEKALDALTRAAPSRIESLRRKYWKAARPQGAPKPGTVFIDKYPLNLIYLGVIARIFPDAIILLALRDPRDSVLSAFKQRFGMNAAMFRMLDIADAAEFYAASMKAAQAGRAGLTVCETRYEDMVADWEAETRRILAALDLNWDEAIRTYRDQARERRINTPSAPQVVQPIYSDSSGRWRAYREPLAPALETLAPWAETWGYAPA